MRFFRRMLLAVATAAPLVLALSAATLDAQRRPAAGAPAAVRPGHDMERLFYMVDTENGYDSFVRNADQISVLGPQIYTVDSLGIIFGSIDARVMRIANEKGIKVMPLIVNEGFHQPSLRKLLANPRARLRAIESMVRLCQDNGYWGIQFDVENVNIEDTDLFVSWYEESARALHAAGFTISIAVVHRMEEEAGPSGYHRFLQDSWRGAFDMTRIAVASDFVTVMTYDQHTRRTPPGPVSSLPWMRDVVTYFLKHVPAEKLSLGIPTYSERWLVRYDGSIPARAASGAETLSYNRARQIVDRYNATHVKWDPELGVEWGYYLNGGVFEWIFIENARGFDARLQLARSMGLRGFSAWVLGPEDPAVWDVLSRR